MEFVCKDLNDTKWFYSDGLYVKKKGDKEVGKIYGQYLPDPIKKWAQKCDVAQVKMGTDESKNYRPTEAVFSLWKHWKEVLNA